ncbi:tetratricopeptide repeat protein [Salibacteraceae bacterium]|nr:tetratricopeptide repeat protein [Salibacteraceae bacterium]
MKSWHYMIVFAVSAAMYVNTLGHGYVLDDKAIITQNKFTQQGFSGIADHFTHSYWFGINGKNAGNYRPISGASFSIEHALFGDNPMIGHLLNILFFGLLCVVLLKWLREMQLMPDHWLYLGMLVFAVHPIHTEVVANIKSRDEIYCFLFFALSAWKFWQGIQSKKVTTLLFSALLYLTALLSKETALALLPIFPVMAYIYNKSLVPTIKNSIGPIITAILFLGIYFSVTDILADQQYHIFDNSLVQEASAGELLATKIWILGEYIKLMIVPYPLIYDYSFNTVQLVDFSNIQVILTIIGAATLIGFLIKSIANVKDNKPLVFILLFLIFILPIIPVSNFLFPIGATMAERFLFIPSLGFIMLFTYGLFLLFEKRNIQNGKISKGIFILIAVPMALTTVARNGAWESDETLFTCDLKHLPRSAKAHHNLANIYKAKAEEANNNAKRVTFYESAARLLEQAIEIYEVQEFHHELGLIYGELGKWEGVKKSLGRYVEMNPTDATAWMQIGIANGMTQQMDNALNAFEKAHELNPSDADICLNLAKTYAIKNDLVRAKEIIADCEKIDPNNEAIQALKGQLP